MLRTMAASYPSQRSMSGSRTPAAMEMNSGRWAFAGTATPFTTGAITWGFTASTTVLAWLTASSLSLLVWTRNASARASSFAESGSLT